VGVYQAQAAHKAFAQGIIAKVRNYQALFIADNHIFDNSSSIDKDTDLSAKFSG
jgi:hypothetical protein